MPRCPPPSQVKGVADAGSAAVRVSGMELGGLFGSLLAGRLSDFLVRKFPNDGAVGKRVQVTTLSLLATLSRSVPLLVVMLHVKQGHTQFTQIKLGGTCLPSGESVTQIDILALS